MTEKRFTTNGYYIYDHFKENEWLVNEVEAKDIVTIMNNLDTKARERSKALSKLEKEKEQLKQQYKDCKKLKGKRLNKIRNHRAVIEDLGGSIRAYKGQISQLNEKIEKINEAMEDTGALTKRQLEEILND